MGASGYCRFCRQGRAHEVSHLNGDVFGRGSRRGRASSAIAFMVPPHCGQEGGLKRIVSFGEDGDGRSVSPALGLSVLVKSERQSASFSARRPLARKPK